MSDRPTAPLRVAIADDSYLIREALAAVLAREASIALVAVCDSGPTLEQAIATERPEVVITDIRMPPSDGDEGIRIAQDLRDSHPEIGVLVLSQYAEPGYARALLATGSDRRGYLLKDRVHDRAELRRAIDTIARGGSVVDPKVVETLVEAKASTESSPLAALTAREREVLALLAQGHSNASIAEALVVTKRAIEKHVNAIFSKLGLQDAADQSRRVKAAIIFLSDG